MQQLQPFRRDLHVRLRDTCYVTTRSVQIGDETELYRIGTYFKDDWNGRGRNLCSKCRRSTGGRNHGHLATNQIGCHRGQSIVLTVRPTIFNRNIATICVAGLFKPFEKCR